MNMLALPTQPRARGRLDLVAEQTVRGTSLKRLHQAGASRALFPQVSGMTAVMLNTSGGVTGGDQFTTSITAEANAALTMTTQAAERFYRAQPGETGQITTTLRAETGARLHWLPQETIVFDRAAVQRRLQVEMALDAEVVLVEPMIFGRAAMGETVRHVSLRDRIDIRRDGELVFADRITLQGDATKALGGPATAHGAGAQAALIVVSPQADRHLGPLRQLMQGTCGVSLIRPGVLFARMVARDGYDLRRHLLPALDVIGITLPRTWAL